MEHKVDLVVEGCIDELEVSINSEHVQSQVVQADQSAAALLKEHTERANSRRQQRADDAGAGAFNEWAADDAGAGAAIPVVLEDFLDRMQSGELKPQAKRAQAWLEAEQRSGAVMGGDADLKYLASALVLIVNLFPVNGEHALANADSTAIAASMNPGKSQASRFHE
jgi:hypothetical protein